MGDTDKDLHDLAVKTTEDFYKLLGVAFDADERAIKRAYRKTSIQYHPDKNSGHDAAERFILLTWAKDILIDPKLKGEYDRARARQREKALQDELLDGRRRKLKEDLERREQESSSAHRLKRKRGDEMSETEKREQDIQRIAADGRRRRQEAQEKRDKQRREEEEAETSMLEVEQSQENTADQSNENSGGDLDRCIKVRFTREGDRADWQKERIEQIFSTFGKIESVVFGKERRIREPDSKHRKNVATTFVVFSRLDHAYAAVVASKKQLPAIESIEWANGEPDFSKYTSTSSPSAPSTPLPAAKRPFKTPGFHPTGRLHTPGTPKFSFSPKTPSLEEVTMIRLKQAEKKRLEDQLRKQEAQEEAA